MLTKLIKKIDSWDLKIMGLSNRTKVMFIFIISLFIFGIILELNFLTPMLDDDLNYCFIFSTKERIQSFSDIIYSQYIHYMQWGGRSVAHIIAQTLLFIGGFWMNVLNSLAYVTLVVVIYLHAKGNNHNHRISVFCLGSLLIWFFQPDYAGTILWITGSSNYLWCTSIILFFLLPYRLWDNTTQKIGIAVIKSFCMFLFGIIAGWTNENTAFAMILMIFFWLFLYRKNKWRIPIWGILGLIGAIVGYLFMILAPGNYARLDTAGGINTFWFTYVYKFMMHTDRFFNFIDTMLLLSFVLFVLVLKFANIHKKYFSYTILIYIISAFIGVYVMIISPQFPDRAFFGPITIIITMLVIILYELNSEFSFIRIIRWGVFMLFAFAFCFSFYGGYKDVKNVRAQWVIRDNIIKNAIKDNTSEISVSSIKTKTRYGLKDGSWASDIWSKYYDMDIQIID